ncbi:MAG: hypothetical protein PHC88_05585 [Terrimicrobiaceae bacterium]|nr:hypothetical protein [Terrimicrobiaceae bacterium]
MHIHIHVELPAAVAAQLDRIEKAISALGGILALDFAKLEAAAAKDESAQNAALVLFQQLAAAIKELKDQVTDPQAQTIIDAFAAKVEARADTFAAAIVANTPAAP